MKVSLQKMAFVSVEEGRKGEQESGSPEACLHTSSPWVQVCAAVWSEHHLLVVTTN